MGFCSYSREFSLSSYTNIENQFIQKYMASADGDAVKVYIFGLYLCQNVQGEYTLGEAAHTLQMEPERVADLFRFWEDFDLLEIVSKDPFSVRYFPADYGKGRPKRIRTEKYADFNKAVQSLMPQKMISASEFMKYFSVMEEYAIKPEAMLLIVRYCIDLKGENIAQNYILQVARNFAAEGVTTVKQIENKLSDYVVRGGDLARILRACGSTKKPEPGDYRLLKKWTEEFGYDVDTIVYTASQFKKGGLAKLDAVLGELYAGKKFGEGEIREYLARKEQVRGLTLNIARELGVYCQVVDTYTDNFVSGWLAAGYDDASLVNLAKYCFRRERKSFEKMDELIRRLVALGVVSAESIVAYIEDEAREQTFAAEVLKRAGAVPPRQQLGPRLSAQLAALEFFGCDDPQGGGDGGRQGEPRPLHHVGALVLEGTRHFQPRTARQRAGILRRRTRRLRPRHARGRAAQEDGKLLLQPARTRAGPRRSLPQTRLRQ